MRFTANPTRWGLFFFASSVPTMGIKKRGEGVFSFLYFSLSLRFYFFFCIVLYVVPSLSLREANSFSDRVLGEIKV